MARILVSAIGFCVVCSAACATTERGVGTTRVTSAEARSQCLTEDEPCVGHADCCSDRCDNYVCVRPEP